MRESRVPWNSQFVPCGISGTEFTEYAAHSPMRKHTKLSCKDVIPINAARMFRNPAPVLLTNTVSSLIESAGRRVLEVGAGCLRNAIYLQRRGYAVTVLEVKGIELRFPEQYDRFKRSGGKVLYEIPNDRFDWALSTFVVETICDVRTRTALVRAIRMQLCMDGFCVFSVRGPKDLVTATAEGIPVSDGYLTPGRSFARSYTRSQFERMLHTCSFDKLTFLHRERVKAPEYLHVVASFH